MSDSIFFLVPAPQVVIKGGQSVVVRSRSRGLIWMATPPVQEAVLDNISS